MMKSTYLLLLVALAMLLSHDVSFAQPVFPSRASSIPPLPSADFSVEDENLAAEPSMTAPVSSQSQQMTQGTTTTPTTPSEGTTPPSMGTTYARQPIPGNPQGIPQPPDLPSSLFAPAPPAAPEYTGLEMSRPYFVQDPLLETPNLRPGWFAGAEAQLLKPTLVPQVSFQTPADQAAGNITIVNPVPVPR